MAKKLTTCMIGDDVETRTIYDVTAEETAMLHNGTLALAALKNYGVGMPLEYELGHFVVAVNMGSTDRLVKGCYPYFTAERWENCDNYEKFYFGGMLLKVNGEWYYHKWVNPNDRYEFLFFEKVNDLEDGLKAAVDMAIADYHKKAA